MYLSLIYIYYFAFLNIHQQFRFILYLKSAIARNVALYKYINYKVQCFKLYTFVYFLFNNVEIYIWIDQLELTTSTYIKFLQINILIHPRPKYFPSPWRSIIFPSFGALTSRHRPIDAQITVQGKPPIPLHTNPSNPPSTPPNIPLLSRISWAPFLLPSVYIYVYISEPRG